MKLSRGGICAGVHWELIWGNSSICRVLCIHYNIATTPIENQLTHTHTPLQDIVCAACCIKSLLLWKPPPVLPLRRPPREKMLGGIYDDAGKAACDQPTPFSLDIELRILTEKRVAGECNFRKLCKFTSTDTLHTRDLLWWCVWIFVCSRLPCADATTFETFLSPVLLIKVGGQTTKLSLLVEN